MNNRDFIAAHRQRLAARRTAAVGEVLLRCPCCGTPNFSPRGLQAHCCKAKPNRERLTPAELEIARQRARAA